MFSFVRAVGGVAALTVIFFVSVQANTPEGCDNLETIKDDFDPYEKSAAKIERSFVNRSAMEISWTVNEADKDGICGYVIHWYQNKTGAEVGHLAVKQPNETSHVIDGLQPGTTYRFYVVSYYTTSHTPRSWTLTTSTDGCGPDVPSFCNNPSTETCNETTGECICKASTIGKRCDKCVDGFYMHKFECVSCDNCVDDGIASNGTCLPVEDSHDTMMCLCNKPYTGKHCKECEEGYYMNQRTCMPCDCNHPKDNEDIHKPSCDTKSGQCICAKGFAGDKCEKCATGYSGNALEEGCFRNQNAGVTALIVIVVIIIVLALAVTCYLTFRRRCKEGLSQGIFRRGDNYDKVNFSTLEEEPEHDSYRNRPSKA